MLLFWLDVLAKVLYNTFLTSNRGAIMYTLQVLNDGNEWELIATVFATVEAAEAFFYEELVCAFNTYIIDEIEIETA
jgi:hypothetical protein